MPVSEMVCAVVDNEVVSENVDVSVPDAVGAKVNVMVQLALAAKELPQVVVYEKSDACPPEIPTLGISSGPVPVLDSVTAEVV